MRKYVRKVRKYVRQMRVNVRRCTKKSKQKTAASIATVPVVCFFNLAHHEWIFCNLY